MLRFAAAVLHPPLTIAEYRDRIADLDWLYKQKRFLEAWWAYLNLLSQLYPSRVGVFFPLYDAPISPWFLMPENDYQQMGYRHAAFRNCYDNIWRHGIQPTIQKRPREDAHHKNGTTPEWWKEHPWEYYVPHPADMESLPRKEHDKAHRNARGAIRIPRPPWDKDTKK